MSNDAFRDELNRLLSERRWPNAVLATRAEIDPSTVTRLMTGTRGASTEIVDRLALAFDLDDHDTLRLHVLASLPERYHHRVRLDEARVIPIEVLMTRLEQAGIGGRDAA